jgi:hypothetical protein
MNLRTYELIIRDLDWNRLDGYAFAEIGSETSQPKIVSPSGIGGFEQLITVQSGPVIDYIVSQTVQKNDIVLNLAFVGPDALSRIESFRNWIAQYIDASVYRTTLRINTKTAASGDSGTDRYVDVVCKKFVPGELKANVADGTLTLQPITLPYSKESSEVIISIVTAALAYPYGYPFAYGGGSYGNSGKITNTFMKKIPLVVIFHGHIVSPQASLQQNGEVYSTIKFSGMDLAKGCSLKVDAVNERIVYTDANGDETDYYNEIDKTESTFLYAKPGESVIAPNLDQTDSTKPSVEVKTVQYTI